MKECERPWEWRALRQDAEERGGDGSDAQKKRERLCGQDSDECGATGKKDEGKTKQGAE